MKRFSIITAIFSVLLLSASAFAQISVSNATPVTENFDGIGTSATAALPANWKMSSAGTGLTANWTTGTNVTATTQAANSGAPTAGGRYNWGTSASDRSIGFMTSGGYASPNSIMSFYRNASGSTINDLTINFQFERYRINTANASVTFFTSTDGTNWTARTAGDIATTEFPTGASTYTFGSPTTVTRSVTLTGVNIPNNGDFYLRWVVNTTGANSQGIGLDEVSVTATLNNPPTLSIDDVSQSEGNAGTTNFIFTVSLSTATHGGVTFNIATADGTATIADNDYANNSLTGQTIPNGSSTYQFTVAVNGDTTVEPDETFFVNVTNVSGATVNDSQGLGTIVNDDVAAATVEFSNSIYFEDESQTAVLTVVRSGDLSGTTTVNYSTQNPAANRGNVSAATGGEACTSGVDFIHQSGTLTFGVEEDFKEIQIQLCGDTVIEQNEAFGVYLSNVTNGTLGSPSTAQVLINDTANEFSNTDPIFIGTGGDSYESSIVVSGIPTNIGGLRVTLFDFNHLTADDIDVLLVGPQGQKFLLMGDAGGDDGLNDAATITFSDNAGRVLPDNSQIFTGIYEPTTWIAGQTSFPAPAPTAPYIEPGSEVGGAVTLASVFGNTNANGTWTLYIRDDNNAFQRVGADGVVAGGWGLQFFAPTAAGVSVGGNVRAGKTPVAGATVMISGGSLSQPQTTKTGSFGNYRFEGLPVGETYIVTVISSRYNFPQSSIVLNVSESVDGADFEAEDR